ncbi:hypothetical protein BB561_001829 [Smittium simulii]|uniref:4-hydroxybenzoate polyprenyltransferase, mitochondrial n=1 Tax=Smittium simulii TaxID=133385 RepID=A0A2T9YT20_9FUNG|nr:hypothetical protein BB561_001829 [Smittium simulii]
MLLLPNNATFSLASTLLLQNARHTTSFAFSFYQLAALKHSTFTSTPIQQNALRTSSFSLPTPSSFQSAALKRSIFVCNAPLLKPRVNTFQDHRTCLVFFQLSPKLFTQYSKYTKAIPTRADTAQLPESELVKHGVAAKLIKKLPPKTQLYFYIMRCDKPIGTMLLFWPGSWSILMASTSLQIHFSQVLLLTSYFALGAFIMRGAGCIINDMWDTEFDKKVSRTAERPLASGKMSIKSAQLLLGSQLSLGLAILLQMNTNTIIYGAMSLPIVALYPFMKRITFWPQLTLGLAFNWGALLGWIAIAGSPNWAVTAPLYAAGIFWTLIYDTIYAHQDKFDDLRVGVKSTALLFNNNTIPVLCIFAVFTISALLLSGYNNGCSYIYYAGIVFGCIPHLIWQLINVDINSQQSCAKFFRANSWFGAIIFFSLLAEYFYSSLNKVDNPVESKNSCTLQQ